MIVWKVNSRQQQKLLVPVASIFASSNRSKELQRRSGCDKGGQAESVATTMGYA